VHQLNHILFLLALGLETFGREQYRPSNDNFVFLASKANIPELLSLLTLFPDLVNVQDSRVSSFPAKTTTVETTSANLLSFGTISFIYIALVGYVSADARVSPRGPKLH